MEVRHVVRKIVSKRIRKVRETVIEIYFHQYLFLFFSTNRDELKIEDIIDELLNQSLIWVDDETFQGNIIYLQKVIVATNNYDELLPLYNNLLSSLKNSQDIPRPSLPEGLIRDISNTFDICGWPKCRDFLVDLGKVL
jgi:glycerol-3-phosphate O-acyltransferase